jgi:hypothetical protein
VLVSAFETAVRRQGKITTDTTAAEILATGDLEIQGRLIPLLRMSHQEYFVQEAQVASYNGRVPLPTRSILGAVRHVQLMYGGRSIALPQRSVEDDVLGVSAGVPTGWYFDGGSVVLLPRGVDATVRLRYYLRPSAMILESDAAVARVNTVTQNSGGYSLVLSNATAGGGAGLPIDIISSASSHEIDAMDVTSSGNVNQLVTAAQLLSPIQVGAYAVTAGFSPVVPVPEEMVSGLVHQTAYVILRSLGYEQEAASQKTLAEEAMGQARAILAPRSEGNPKRLRGGIRASLGVWGSRGRW